MIRALVSIIVLYALCIDKGRAEQTIIWQSFHSPPSSIRVGEQKDQGFVDLALKMIIDRLPQYRHQTQWASLSGALEHIKGNKNVCHPSLFVTEQRREFAYFAHPSIISPSNRLITTLANQQKYQLSEPVDLQTAMSTTEMTLALVQGRFYGSTVNQFLQPNEGLSSRVMQLSTERLDTMFNLVIKEKVSATVSYPFELGYFKQQRAGMSRDLISLTIKGIEPYAVGSIACAKTPWGKQVINAINKVVLELRSQPEYLATMTTWWQDELKNEDFRRFYRETFLVSTEQH